MNSDIRQKLDKITDTMWSGGLANPITYVEQLSYLLYLKLLDEAENQHSQAELLGITLDRPTLFPAQAKRYRWSEWRFKSGRDLLDFVSDEVFPYMSSLVREAPSVATFFADARFQFEDPHVFKEVVDILDTFQFAKLGPDVKGDIFEYQLLKLQNQAKSDLGQFRTPRQLRQFMVQLVDPDIGDSIYDPACGTAGFLVEALDHILAKYSSETREIPIYGEGWEESKGYKSVEAAKNAIPNLQTYQRGVGDRLAKEDWKKKYLLRRV
jgi:type I restriction enzyme M protein